MKPLFSQTVLQSSDIIPILRNRYNLHLAPHQDEQIDKEIRQILTITETKSIERGDLLFNKKDILLYAGMHQSLVCRASLV